MKQNTILKKCWIWSTPVSELVKKLAKGYTLNICAGKSDIGDIKIDLDPQDNTIIKGDMRNIAFADNTFDTVIQDPPWRIGVYQRAKPFFECVRVCKIGGIIIYNAYWIPTSKCVKLKEIYVRQEYDFCNTSIISIFEKVNHA